jgi:RND superfamily putative drug exporter
MNHLAACIAGRRSKYLVLVAWLAVVAAMAPLGARFEDAQENDPASFLPGGAESLEVLRSAGSFPSGDVAPAVVILHRASGLTEQDGAFIEQLRRSLNEAPPGAARAPREPVRSGDGKGALLTVPIDARGDAEALNAAVDEIRNRLDGEPAGLETAVSGPAGFSRDAAAVFEGINGLLLAATAALVFVLLIVIYRSPIFWALPLLAVAFAEATVRGLGFLLTEAGVTINGQVAGITLVLVFGAGTDYALLLVARYREELHRFADPHDAMRVALQRAAPSIVASAGTVVAGLLCLVLADVNGTAGLGPFAAIGVGVAMLAMVTLLPALLLIAGRRAFWPLVPRAGAASPTHASAWRRLGEWIDARRRPVWITSVALLAVLATGVLTLDDDLTSTSQFRGDVEAVRGQELLALSFSAGANAPTSVLVRDPALVEATRDAVEGVPGVVGLGPTERAAGRVRFDVVLAEEPYSEAAYGRIADLRAAVRDVAGAAALVGGPTAEERDLRRAAQRDLLLLVPLILAVVLLILVLLLRSLLAPILLMATVVLSFAAALGVGVVVSEWVFGFAGESADLPLFAFVFLVALGVDYNIFLVARAREEAFEHGTREGMLRGLATTGSVITSAGIVLAGTFLVLAILPFVPLTQLGFTVAFGVLLDTLLVRSVLVPALVLDVGSRVWWPSRLAEARDGCGRA